jgi:hypothetical protein
MANTSLFMGLGSLAAVRAAVSAARAAAGPDSPSASARGPLDALQASSMTSSVGGPHYHHQQQPQPAGLPPVLTWLGDWRLRAALAAPRRCGELSLQLALAAAVRGGRVSVSVTECDPLSTECDLV